MHGTATSQAEVTHVFKHGFWLLLNNEELLVPFAKFPWFKQATIEQLSAVEWPRSLSDLGIVGCKSTAAVHFSPSF